VGSGAAPPPDSPEGAFHASAPPAQPGEGPPPRRGPRWLPLGFGIALAIIGVLLALAGGAVLAIFGGDGEFDSGSGRLESPTAALVSEVADIQYDDDATEVLGDTALRLSANSAGGERIFVGIGPAAEVDQYLSGVAIDRVTDIEVDPFRVQSTRQPGTAEAEAPSDQTFWVAKNQSDGKASVEWKLRDGDYRFVVMNADGSPGVSADASLGVTIPNLPDIGLGLLVVGLLVLIGGVVLIVVGVRRPRPSSSA
jgi:hypothetical protein